MTCDPADDVMDPKQRWTVLHVGLGVLFLLGALIFGRWFGHELPRLEAWIAQQGWVGWAVFILLVVSGTSVFIPDTVFALTAGVLFGFLGGAAVMCVAVLLTAGFNFAVSRRFLHGTIRRWLAGQPRLAAVERAVNREGLRFQFLLRLTPLSPVSVSYLLGTTNTRFGTFLLASLGLLPGVIVEVYFGHVAKHLAQVAHAPGQHGHLHLVLTVLGMLVCVAVMVYLGRIARAAVAEAEKSDLSQLSP